MERAEHLQTISDVMLEEDERLENRNQWIIAGVLSVDLTCEPPDKRGRGSCRSGSQAWTSTAAPGLYQQDVYAPPAWRRGGPPPRLHPQPGAQLAAHGHLDFEVDQFGPGARESSGPGADWVFDEWSPTAASLRSLASGWASWRPARLGDV